jgi:hypothetical protein
MLSNGQSLPAKAKLEEKDFAKISVNEALQMISYLSGASILSNEDLAFLMDVGNLKELYAQGRLIYLI